VPSARLADMFGVVGSDPGPMLPVMFSLSLIWVQSSIFEKCKVMISSEHEASPHVVPMPSNSCPSWNSHALSTQSAPLGRERMLTAPPSMWKTRQPLSVQLVLA